jgi:hypothetical protein
MLLAQKSIKIDHLRCVFRLAQFIVLPGQTNRGLVQVKYPDPEAKETASSISAGLFMYP